MAERRKKNLDILKEDDQYSALLFVLYKLTDVEEYAVISKLVYTLKKDNLLNLCRLFGGQTIRIPTLEELGSVARLLLLYQYVDIQGMDYNDAVRKVNFPVTEVRRVKPMYLSVKKILETYNIGGSDDK